MCLTRHCWQDTVAEMAKDIKAKRTGEMSATAAELYTFINRVRGGSVALTGSRIAGLPGRACMSHAAVSEQHQLVIVRSAQLSSAHHSSST